MDTLLEHFTKLELFLTGALAVACYAAHRYNTFYLSFFKSEKEQRLRYDRMILTFPEIDAHRFSFLTGTSGMRNSMVSRFGVDLDGQPYPEQLTPRRYRDKESGELRCLMPHLEKSTTRW